MANHHEAANHTDIAESVASTNSSTNERRTVVTSAGGATATALGGPSAILDSLMLAVFLATLDAIIVATSLSAVLDRWISSMFFITSTMTTALGEKLCTIFGRRVAVAFAVVLFLARSALCGAESTMESLIVGRAIAGLGKDRRNL
ncbi:hypothetical protein HK405_005523 [Cladochytrium tenue]|nr:hypothetical protein HK405_005523 [Cladochytrium tenue]